MTHDLDENTLFSETHEQATNRIIREAGPFAAAAIVALISDETASATVRLNASRYVVDRLLGPINADTKQDELEAFLMELQGEANSGR
jgi:propanediol utilization protein